MNDALDTWENDGGKLTPRVEPATAASDPGQGDEAGDGKSVSNQSAGLPDEMADRFTKPLARFFKIKAVAGFALVATTCVALLLSNSPWHETISTFWDTRVGLQFGSFVFARSLRHWVSDGLMTFFFFVVALELKTEMVLGELNDWRRSALPLAAAVGGMVVPASIYVFLMRGQAGVNGWGTVTATDTAFVIGCLAVLGNRVPSALRLFLLSLAIFDDVGAILVVAFGYSEGVGLWGIGLAGAAIALLVGASWLGIRSVALYYIVGGLLWTAFDSSGIHPTVAGVVLGLLTPARSWVDDARLRAILGGVLAYPLGEHWSGDTQDRADLRRAGRAARETLSPAERMQLSWHPIGAFLIMPLFSLANAGVTLAKPGVEQPVFWAIVASLFAGKPLGVLAFTWAILKTGLARKPASLSWPVLAGGALLSGIGFTMSVFVAGLSFTPDMLNTAKAAILCASIGSATVGMAILYIVGSRVVKAKTKSGSQGGLAPTPS